MRRALLAAAALALAACAVPERRPPVEAPRPPEGAPPPREERRARPPLPPKVGPPAGRPIRVQVGVHEGPLRIEGEGLRIHSLRGSLLAESGVGAAVLAAGDGMIRWGSAGSSGTPVDVSALSDLRVKGERLPSRLRVSAQGRMLSLVAVVPLEEYVVRVLSREAPPGFRREALAAQAVAIRSYAEAAMEKPKGPDFDVVSTVDDQVFSGTGVPDGVFREAVEETSGRILLFEGKPARAVYHSTCGGRTESGSDAWGGGAPYLRSVACDDCRESPAWRWEHRMDAAEGRRVAALLGVRAGTDLKIGVSGRTATGRAVRVRLSSGRVEREVQAAAFRRTAGYDRVRSLKMDITPLKAGWLVLGEGYGHGVGLCQWGANGMAARGFGYREILERYYHGAVIGERPL